MSQRSDAQICVAHPTRIFAKVSCVRRPPCGLVASSYDEHVKCSSRRCGALQRRIVRAARRNGDRRDPYLARRMAPTRTRARCDETAQSPAVAGSFGTWDVTLDAWTALLDQPRVQRPTRCRGRGVRRPIINGPRRSTSCATHARRAADDLDFGAVRAGRWAEAPRRNGDRRASSLVARTRAGERHGADRSSWSLEPGPTRLRRADGRHFAGDSAPASGARLLERGGGVGRFVMRRDATDATRRRGHRPGCTEWPRNVPRPIDVQM